MDGARPRHSARGVIVDGDAIALIERVRGGGTYYVFPGGGVEAGETPADALRRECREELGLLVDVEGYLGTVHFRKESIQEYFRLRIVGGTFGTGDGEEYQGRLPPERGTYRPVWLLLDDLPHCDVRPRFLARALLQPDGNLPFDVAE